VPLAHHEQLAVPVGVAPVLPVSAAVTRRPARHRDDLGSVCPNRPEQPIYAGHLLWPAPPAAPLGDDVRLIIYEDQAEPARAAVARRRARHRTDLAHPWIPHVLRGAPAPVLRI